MRQSNLAYDFELFEPRARQTQPALKPVAEAGQKYKKRDRMLVVRVVSTVMVMVTVISLMLISRAQLTSLTDQIGDFNQQYQTLLSENTRLKAQLESKVSLRSVEESAQALGLSKVRSDQVEYVVLEGEETVTLSGEWKEPTLAEKVTLYIQSFLEYISIW